MPVAISSASVHVASLREVSWPETCSRNVSRRCHCFFALGVAMSARAFYLCGLAALNTCYTQNMYGQLWVQSVQEASVRFAEFFSAPSLKQAHIVQKMHSISQALAFQATSNTSNVFGQGRSAGSREIGLQLNPSRFLKPLLTRLPVKKNKKKRVTPLQFCGFVWDSKQQTKARQQTVDDSQGRRGAAKLVPSAILAFPPVGCSLTQKAQYPSIKEYSLNRTKDPLFFRYIP